MEHTGVETPTLNGPVERPQESNQCSVHPGWLLHEVPAGNATLGNEQAIRFTAFTQLLRTAAALDRAATDILADLDLTAGAFGALLELETAGERGLAPSELARRLAVARRTATLYIDILARQGWAERHAHPEDRRMVLARLTSSGKRIVAELGEAYRGRLAALMGDMTPLQAERLRQLLAVLPIDSTTGSGH